MLSKSSTLSNKLDFHHFNIIFNKKQQDTPSISYISILNWAQLLTADDQTAPGSSWNKHCDDLGPGLRDQLVVLPLSEDLMDTNKHPSVAVT